MHGTMSPRPHAAGRSGFEPLRLLAATLVLALAGGLVQTANAAPDGMHGAPGAMPGIIGMGHGAGMDGMLMAHPRQMERLFDSIGATAEQRAQIQQIAQAARTDLHARREAAEVLREQGRALFAQPTIDQKAVEALRQQMLARHDQASKRMMQALLEMGRVLTPDQRKAMSELMVERRAKMERQRAERESSAGTKR